MKSLVDIVAGEIVTDSKIVAKELGAKHSFVIEVINDVLNDFPDLRVQHDATLNSKKPIEYCKLENRTYRGQDFIGAVMNREFFTLLVMRFRSEKAKKIQRAFNSAFYEMERRLLQVESNQGNQEWITQRNQSKLGRRLETDVIQKFVDYATSQGSENAKYYYKHLTNASYKALGLIQHKQPKLRDTLDWMELSWLTSAEWVARQSILKHMEANEHYKAIFVLAKQDIEKFADGLMLPRLNQGV
jgi:Rha family phage regulatory protein